MDNIESNDGYEGNSEDIDIFDAVPQENRNYFSFKNVGDQIQGTYIARVDNIKNKFGSLQTLISLKTKGGEIKTVTIGNNKKGLMEAMEPVKFGQIIGFRFTGTKEHNDGRQPTKFIRLVQDPKIVDTEWLNSPKPEQAIAPVSETSASPVTPSTGDKVQAVLAMAKIKLGITDETKIKEVIMEKTGMAFININLDTILERLSKM